MATSPTQKTEAFQISATLSNANRNADNFNKYRSNSIQPAMLSHSADVLQPFVNEKMCAQ